MYRKRISSTCCSSRHLFPVARKYQGLQWWRGRLVYVMVCPACGSRKFYIYLDPYHYTCVGLQN